MFSISSYVGPKRLWAVSISAVLLTAACAPQYPPSQSEKIQSSNPTITYQYSDDQGLLRSNQQANEYCRQYHSVAQASNTYMSSDGSKTVVFECTSVQTAPVQQSSFSPNVQYTYNSDQQLLNVTRGAEAYCMNTGSQRAVLNSVANSDGSRTVIYHCAQ